MDVGQKTQDVTLKPDDVKQAIVDYLELKFPDNDVGDFENIQFNVSEGYRPDGPMDMTASRGPHLVDVTVEMILP